MWLRRASFLGAVAALALVAEEKITVGPGQATAASTLAAGTLDFRVTTRVTSEQVACPTEAAPGSLECRERKGTSGVRGLGTLTTSYVWSFGYGSPPCPSGEVKALATTTGSFLIAGKGEIHFALAEGTQCVGVELARNQPQNFTITGGTGTYQGASGGGTVMRSLEGGVGSERWAGTIVVPGLEFDVTPPTMSGVVSKSVRAPRGAKSVRVTYK